jgi:hypothetical protein
LEPVRESVRVPCGRVIQIIARRLGDSLKYRLGKSIVVGEYQTATRSNRVVKLLKCSLAISNITERIEARNHIKRLLGLEQREGRSLETDVL